MSTQPGDRDMMFCHECHDEWYRDKHGFTCPECGSDFTELIDPSYPPKNGISDETSSQGQTPDILVSDEFRLLNSPLRGPKDSASLSKSRSPSQDINPTISQDHTAGRIHVEKQILTANNHTDSLGPGSLGRLTVEAMRKATRGQLTVNKTSPTNNQLPKLHRTLALSAPRNNSDSSPSVHPNQRQAQVSDSAISSGRPSGAETDISTSDSQSRRNHSGRGPDSTVVSDSVQPHAPIITNGVEKLLDNGQGIAYPPLHATAIGCDLHDCGFRTELENMRVMMDRLRQENIRLSTNLARSLQRSMPTRCVVLHQVSLGCSEKQSSIFSSTEMTYFDPPHWTKDVNGIWHVEAQNPVQEPQIFLERQKRSDVALILSLEYTVTANADSELQREFTQGPMIPESASAQLLCPVLKSAWSSLLDNDRLMKKYCRINRPEAPKYHDTGHKDYKIFDLNIFYYHFRLRIRKGAQMLTKPQQKQLDILLRSIDTSFGKQYEEAERLLGEGLVTSTIVPYLFVPNSVLICNHCQSVSGLRLESFIRREKFIGSPSYTAKTMCWGFDGKFYELTKPLTVQVGNDGEKPRTISSLDVFPLVYAPSEIKSRLRERGSKYWALRKAAYVTYKGWSMKQDIVYKTQGS
ncbi:hypothetical protein GQ43DRAFT_271191 [Delitschia confertaspora ATCC 74209]|uniref:DUF7025 domain-containing protein n=1 Tax=Delitschia confertaspora ATCC 74209 TaxID=1513339 RepID=A0A9P4JVM2_9PLEO|nr:hypothetical protein GQ43DRAFT_271191 [Delitschia confertaspora ATCC 74209]